MRITRLRATPINIPLEAPMWWTGGLYPGTSKIIVEVETDVGLIGLGEALSTDVLRTIEAIGERLVGEDPLDIAACESRCVPPWQIVQNTDDASVVKGFGAVEIGLWDLRGEAWASYSTSSSAARSVMPSRSPSISASARAGRPCPSRSSTTAFPCARRTAAPCLRAS
jgi:glucarate dehydratase